jgi:hypothetical protein
MNSESFLDVFARVSRLSKEACGRELQRYGIHVGQNYLLELLWETSEGLIPSCVLRSHSEMGEIGHRTEKWPIVFKLTQLITKGINNGFKRRKSTIIKGFFPYFLPNMLNGIQFRTVGRLRDQTNIRLP